MAHSIGCTLLQQRGRTTEHPSELGYPRYPQYPQALLFFLSYPDHDPDLPRLRLVARLNHPYFILFR